MAKSRKEELTEKVMLLNAMSLNRYHIVYQNGLVYLKDQMNETITVCETVTGMIADVGTIICYCWREERCR